MTIERKAPWLVVAIVVLGLLGALYVVRVVFGLLWRLFELGVVVSVIALVAYGVGAASRSRR